MRMMRCQTYRKKHYSCEVPIHYAVAALRYNLRDRSAACSTTVYQSVTISHDILAMPEGGDHSQRFRPAVFHFRVSV